MAFSFSDVKCGAGVAALPDAKDSGSASARFSPHLGCCLAGSAQDVSLNCVNLASGRKWGVGWGREQLDVIHVTLPMRPVGARLPELQRMLGKWSAHLSGVAGASAIREEGEVEVGRQLAAPTCPRNLKSPGNGPFHEEMSIH